MKVRYRLIENGVPVREQIKEYDGSYEANKKQIEDDQFTGVDPGDLARAGGLASWIEAQVIS